MNLKGITEGDTLKWVFEIRDEENGGELLNKPSATFSFLAKSGTTEIEATPVFSTSGNSIGYALFTGLTAGKWYLYGICTDGSEVQTVLESRVVVSAQKS